MSFRNVGRSARLGAVGAVCCVAAAIMPVIAHASVGVPQYPDLRAMPPVKLKLAKRTVSGEVRHFLDFQPKTYNAGPGALEVQRVPQSSGIADLNQRVYESPAGYRDERLTAVAFASPFTFPIPDFQRYEVWAERTFRRASERDFRRGAPLYVTDDVRQCVADTEQIDETAMPLPTYQQCSTAVMGISRGWADVDFLGEPHMIDFGDSPLPDGRYVLRAIVDPNNLIWESDGKSDDAKEGRVANQALTNFEIVKGNLAWVDP